MNAAICEAGIRLEATLLDSVFKHSERTSQITSKCIGCIFKATFCPVSLFVQRLDRIIDFLNIFFKLFFPLSIVGSLFHRFLVKFCVKFFLFFTRIKLAVKILKFFQHVSFRLHGGLGNLLICFK